MINKDQFDILEKIACEQLDIVNNMDFSVMNECINLGYIHNNQLTQKGLEALEPFRVKRAIFLAAGLGNRLLPLTNITPKPLIKIHGKSIIESGIEACMSAGIDEIIIVRGHLSSMFDELLKKYPNIKFVENKYYSETNNISSIFVTKDYLPNSYIIDADLLVYNPKIIKTYQYTSNFMGIKTQSTNDWCFIVENEIILDERHKGQGDNVWLVVGISYWNETDGLKLSYDIENEFINKGKTDLYWEFVPLKNQIERYNIFIRDCSFDDVVEIDTLKDLKQLDESYNDLISEEV